MGPGLSVRGKNLSRLAPAVQAIAMDVLVAVANQATMDKRDEKKRLKKSLQLPSISTSPKRSLRSKG
jgi:hypothetical protein